MTFDIWMDEVEKELMARWELTSNVIPDPGYDLMFMRGINPQEGAKEAVEYAEAEFAGMLIDLQG